MTARRAPDGRWVAGVSGNPAGRRSSAVDFAALVAEHRGSDMRETLLAVYDKLATMARDGDVAAMRLLLDRLCAPATDVGLSVSVETQEPQDPVAAARRITAMLALAARVQPSLAGDVCRTMLAAVGQEQFGEQLRDRLRELRGDASP